MTLHVRTTSGYTLLELVLVLAILATALAAVAPSLRGFTKGRKPEEAARQFVALTRWARSQAISDGVTYQLVIDPHAGTWHLSVEEGDSFTDINSPFGRVYSCPEEVTLQTDIPAIDGQQAIVFDSSGRSDVGAVRFVGGGSTIEVACDAPVDEFHVVTDEEVKR